MLKEISFIAARHETVSGNALYENTVSTGVGISWGRFVAGHNDRCQRMDGL